MEMKMPAETARWYESEMKVPICSEDVQIKGYACGNCGCFVIMRRQKCPDCGTNMLAWDDEKNWK